MRAIIVDDEQHALELFKKVLDLFEHDIEVVGEASDLQAALDLIEKKSPDVVFMDIDMPKYSGLEINSFHDAARTFELVFVTAHSQYAIDAIKISTFDYLLKPLDPQALQSCYHRLKQKIESKSKNTKSTEEEIISVLSHNGTFYVNTKDILYLEASGVYCIIQRIGGPQIIVSKPMGEFIKTLPPNFKRIHRSYCVNLQHVEKKSGVEANELELTDGSKVPISRQYKTEIDELIKNSI